MKKPFLGKINVTISCKYESSETGNFDRTTGLTLGFEEVPDPPFPNGSKESILLSVVPNEAKGSPFPKGSSYNRLISWSVYE